MFCNNCGSELKGNEQFCANCGAKIETKEVETDKIVEAPITETVVEPVVEEKEDKVEQTEEIKQEEKTEVVSSETETPKMAVLTKKRSKKALWLGLGIASVIIAVLAALVALNFSSVKNFVKKTVSSDEEYFRYIHKEQGSDIAESFSKAITDVAKGYNDLSSSMASMFRTNGKLSVKVNKPVINLLNQYVAGSGMSFDWLNDADAVMEVVFDGKDKFDSDVVLKINGTEIATANYIYDFENYKLYISLPGMNDEYVCIDINPIGAQEKDNIASPDGMVYIEQYSAVQEATPSAALNMVNVEAFTKNLPEQKVLETLINKYITLVLDNIQEVEKENDTIEVGGITCKCTKYTVNVDEDLVQDIFKAVLTELKDDEIVKKYIVDTAEELGEDGDEIYDSFRDSLKDALDNLDELEMEDFDYTIWVDSAGNTVAFEIEIDSFKVVYKTLEKDGKFATELSVGDDEMSLGFTNEGTEKSNKKNSETRFKMNGTTYLIVEATDLDDKGGKLTVSLGQGLKDIIKMAPNQLLTQFADAKLVLDIATTEESDNIKLALTLKDEEWFSISRESANGETKPIEVPSKYVDVNNSTEMQNWIKKADFDKLLENLTAAKVPQELVSQLRSMVNQLKQ